MNDLGNGGESRGEERGARADDPEALAAYLADRLRDWRSLGFYRKVSRALPERVVRDALACALDVPARAVRRSRGAYFTSIVVKAIAGLRRLRPTNSERAPYDD